MTHLDAHVKAHRERVDVDLPLSVGAGQVTALLGPNGSGKSTALAVIAGLLRPAGGHVRSGGRTLHDQSTWLPPERRRVGMVFQDGRLFSHLSALDNVAYGPLARGMSRREARRIALDQLASVGAESIAQARTSELSGGQAQRVALARALATEPDILLLDEPLSALDAGSRIGVRADLRRYLAGFAGATVVVTHDIVDATALADRVVVIERGVPTQSASPSELVTAPATDYVAQLAGILLLRGTGHGDRVSLDGGGEVLARAPRGPVLVAVRPHDVRLHATGSTTPATNAWNAQVTDVEQRGLVVRVEVGTDGGPALVSEVDALRSPIPSVGSRVLVSVEAENLVVYSR